LRHEVIQLSEGWAGTDQTVAKAREMVNASLTDPLIVTTAQNIVRNVRERDKWTEVVAISNFVRSHIRYTNEGIETLKTPRLMLEEIERYGKAVGDCDDHVILWAALLRAVGFSVRYRVISQRPDQLANHIYGEVLVPGRGWVGDDTIVKWRPVGWSAPPERATRDRIYGELGGYSMYATVGRMAPAERIARGGAYHAMIVERRAKRRRAKRRRAMEARREAMRQGEAARPAGWGQSGGAAHQSVSDFIQVGSDWYHTPSVTASSIVVKRGGALHRTELGGVAAVSIGDFLGEELGKKKKKFFQKIGKALKKGAPLLKKALPVIAAGGGLLAVGTALAKGAKKSKKKRKEAAPAEAPVEAPAESPVMVAPIPTAEVPTGAPGGPSVPGRVPTGDVEEPTAIPGAEEPSAPVSAGMGAAPLIIGGAVLLLLVLGGRK
jgi:hypothetical protein